MSLLITSLNSGSNGNCYYVGNDDEAVLIDAGISCRETEKRMNRLGLSFEKVKAIFITHEHKDHISGIPTIAKKYQLPIYITQPTQRLGRIKLDKDQALRFRAGQIVRIGKLSVKAFSKMHDAGDPHSFIVENGSVRVGIFTDIGIACREVIDHFRQCHAAFLESNYDEEMLQNGDYPFYLKKRISDGRGHLSNAQALELFLKHRPAFMSHLILSHLSRNNNDPELVSRLFNSHAGSTQIIVASRDMETELYRITTNGSVEISGLEFMTRGQLSLF